MNQKLISQSGSVKLGGLILVMLIAFFAVFSIASMPTGSITPISGPQSGTIDINFSFLDVNVPAHSFIDANIVLLTDLNVYVKSIAYDTNILDANYSSGITCAVSSGSTDGNCSYQWNTIGHDGNYRIEVILKDSDNNTNIVGPTAMFVISNSSAHPENPTAPDLGEAGRFVIFAGTIVTTTSGSVISGGDIGLASYARSTYSGFTPTGPAGDFTQLSNGTSYAADDANPSPFPSPLHYSTIPVGAQWTTTGAMITQTNTDLSAADTFLGATNSTAPNQVCPAELGGLTLTKGVYKTAVNVTINDGNLYLDAQGDPSAVFIFVIAGTLTNGPIGNIVLKNSAVADNVYWRTGGITTIAANTTFYGNVFAASQVNAITGAHITGRLFALTGQVTLQSNTVTLVTSTSDTTAAVTTASGADFTDWNNLAQTVTLTCVDTAGTGCHDINYSVDGGTWIDSNVMPVTFTLTTDGNHLIMYYSTDNNYNVETPPKTSYVAIDGNAPIITGSATTMGFAGADLDMFYGLDQNIKIRVTSMDITSGVASLDVNFADVNGTSAWVRATMVDANTFNINTGHGWTHNFTLTTLKVRINDNAGNSTASTPLVNPILLYDMNVPSGLGGQSTGFQTITNFEHVNPLIFEKVGLGRITFLSDVNMADQTVAAQLQSLATAITIGDGNYGNKIVNFDTSGFSGKLAGIVVNVKLFGLPFATTPGLLHDGVRCDDNPALCTLSYAAGTLDFNSTLGFSQYDADGNAPTIVSVGLDNPTVLYGDTPLLTVVFSEPVTGFDNGDITLIENGTLSAVSSADGGINWTATFTPNANVTDASNVITVSSAGVTDRVGNAGVGDTNSSNYGIDANRPKILSVTTSAADGTYGDANVGVTISITITFDQTVWWPTLPTAGRSETSSLALNSGSTAEYASGSGTTVLTYAYIIASGDETADLTYVGTNSLTVAGGGKILDISGNEADYTLPAPSVFAAAHAIVIDLKAPVLTDATSVGSTTATLGVTISESATCKYTSNMDLNYDTITDSATSAATSASWSLSGLSVSTAYTKNVWCRDLVTHDTNKTITFTTTAAPPSGGSSTVGGRPPGSGTGEASTTTLSETSDTYAPTADEITQLLGGATDDSGAPLYTPEEIAAMAANTTDYTFTKTVKVEEITDASGNVSYRTTLTISVTNNNGTDMSNVLLVETIPKAIASTITASQITSVLQFRILAADPVIQFTVPLIRAGETYTASYSVDTNTKPTVAGANFASPAIGGETVVEAPVAPPVTPPATPPATPGTAPGTAPVAQAAAGMDMGMIAIIVVILAVIVVAGYAVMNNKKKKKM